MNSDNDSAEPQQKQHPSSPSPQSPAPIPATSILVPATRTHRRSHSLHSPQRLVLETRIEDEPRMDRFMNLMSGYEELDDQNRITVEESGSDAPAVILAPKTRKKKRRTGVPATLPDRIISYQAGAHPSDMISTLPTPTTVRDAAAIATNLQYDETPRSSISSVDESRTLLHCEDTHYPSATSMSSKDVSPSDVQFQEISNAYKKSPLVSDNQSRKDTTSDEDDSKTASSSKGKRKNGFFQRLLSSRTFSGHNGNLKKMSHMQNFIRTHQRQPRFSQTDTESLSGEPPHMQIPLRITVHLHKGDTQVFDNVDDFQDYIQQLAQEQQGHVASRKKRSTVINTSFGAESRDATSATPTPRARTRSGGPSTLTTTGGSASDVDSADDKKDLITSASDDDSATTYSTHSLTTQVPTDSAQKTQRTSLDNSMHASASTGNLTTITDTPSSSAKTKKKPRSMKIDLDSGAKAATPRTSSPISLTSRDSILGMRRARSSDNFASTYGAESNSPSSSSASNFEVLTFNNDEPPIWIDILAPEASDMEVLGDLFALHPLTVEDCLNPAESGDKYEVMQDVQHKSIYLFLVVKNVSDTLNIIIFKNFVVTIHLKEVATLEKVCQRLEAEYQREILIAQANMTDMRHPKRLRNEASLVSSSSFHTIPTPTHYALRPGTVSAANAGGTGAHPVKRNKRRKKQKTQANKLYTQQSSSPNFILSPSHIAYLYFDQIVDQFLGVSRQKLLHVDDEENVIMQLGTDDMDDALLRLNIIRRETRMLRRYLFPKKNIINDLMNLDRIPFLCTSTKIGLRDVYDHLNSAVENLEEEMTELNAIQARYLMKMNAEAAANNNRMVQMASRHDAQLGRLTIITAIFAPLSLLSGIFGMNTWVPGTVTPANEITLGSYLWFAGVMIFMIFVGLGMLICFRDEIFNFNKRRWRRRYE